MDALNQSGAAPDALQMVDSTVVRAHQQAASARGSLDDRVLAAQERTVEKRSTGSFSGPPSTSRPRSTSASMQQAGLWGLRSRRDRHSIIWGSTSSWPTTCQRQASCWQTKAMTLTKFGKNGGAERAHPNSHARITQDACRCRSFAVLIAQSR